MKSIYHLLIICCILFAHAAKAQNGEAYAYLTTMGEQYENIKKETWSYMKAVGHGKSARKIDKRRKSLLEAIKESNGNMKKLKPFQGDNTLRAAAIDYLSLTYLVLNEDYSKIMDLEEIAENSYDNMEAYLTAKKVADERLQEAGVKLDTAQNLFATTHGINIVEANDKISENIEKAGLVMDYYNELYLIFFKSYKQELYVFDAINRNDLVSLEQNKNTLAGFAEDGISEVNNIGSFNGDPIMKIALLELLSFYKYEAGDPFDQMVDFMMTKDNFEKLNKAIQNKKNPSKEEIDEYNAYLTKYNKAVNDYNTLNVKLNKKRIEVIDNWNSKTEIFMGKHVPK